MPRMIFVNLPVRDLAVATRFYEALGCRKDERFSDHQASSMVWSDTISFHLLATDCFAGFAPRKVADAHAAVEVLLALTFDSREAVDAAAEAAAGYGGKADVRAPMDMGWLYNRAFQDPDGHVFEAIHMDGEAAASAPP